MPEPCPHTYWIAETTTDDRGMVVEHCANPKCKATRKVYGSWENIVSAGLINTRLPKKAVFPKLDHDSIDEIMKEIQSGGGKAMSQVSKTMPQFPEKTNAPTATPTAIVPFLNKSDADKKEAPKKNRYRYGYMKKHKTAIIADIFEMGEEKAREKWEIPKPTWQRYVKGKWRDLIYATPIVSSARGGAASINCPCPDMVKLKKFEQEMQEYLLVFRSIKKIVEKLFKER